jgi:hypothetical protein
MRVPPSPAIDASAKSYRDYRFGIDVANRVGMIEEQGNEREGAQRQSPAERERKKNPSARQDLEKPPEGRDEPPDAVKKVKRSPKTPWMGGG